MRGILTYHSVDPSGSPISIGEGPLRAHLRWLASREVQVVPLEWIHKVPADRHAVAITFDDGFQNFADVAWPLFKHHDMPLTLFVATGRVGTDNRWDGKDSRGIPTLPLADWDALRKMVDKGLTLGSHSRTHPHLESLDDARLAEETRGSADDLERETGVRPQAFCYPYGTFDARAVELVRKTYAVACTTELAALPDDPDVHRLPRLDAFYYRGNARLERWGSGSFRRHLALRAFGRSVRKRLGAS